MKIKLTENKIKKLIAESVKNTLKEHYHNVYENKTLEMMQELKDIMGPEHLCDRLLSRLVGQIDWRGAYETLQDIYNVECGHCLEDEE